MDIQLNNKQDDILVNGEWFCSMERIINNIDVMNIIVGLFTDLETEPGCFFKLGVDW